MVQLEPPFQAVMIHMEEQIGYHHLLLHKIEELYGVERVLVAMQDDHHVAILTFGMSPVEAEVRLQSVMQLLTHDKRHFRVGCSSWAEHLQHLDELMREARFALSHVARSGEKKNYIGLEPQWIVSQAGRYTRTSFAHRILEHINVELRETLHVFFQSNQHLGLTAETLYVHKNTVIYRLRKIEQLTGLNPQHFHDALALQVALWCLPFEQGKTVDHNERGQ